MAAWPSPLSLGTQPSGGGGGGAQQDKQRIRNLVGDQEGKDCCEFENTLPLYTCFIAGF